MSEIAPLDLELRKQGEELVRMGRQLIARAALLTEQPKTFSEPNADAETIFLAREAYGARRRRASFFRGDLFGEPAWDMLLDLYAHTKLRTKISVSSVCIGSGAPMATALRYVALLTREGLIHRENDERDARRSWLTLTPKGLESMRDYLLSSDQS